MQAHATTTQSPFERFAEGNPNVEINRSFWVTNALVVTVDTDRIPLQRLGAVDNVERIHENYNLSLATTAGSTATSHPQRSDTQIGTQQPVAPQLEPTTTRTTDGLAQINVADAWEYTKGGSTSIAVLDTGVDPTHPDIDIDPSNWNDWDTDGSPRDTAPQDYGSHGTHVSGTAVGGNASGTRIGVAPKAELYHGAALNQNCDRRCGGTVAQLYAGMEWAIEQDVDVISMSLGGVDESDNFIDELVPAVRSAQDAGIVVVAAAGNKPIDTTISPGNIYDSISVGATNTDETIADFSSSETINADDWGDPPADWPDTYTVPTVAAPGNNIYSSLPGDRYGQLSGTSMATPHVSGTVALMQAASSESLSPDEIRSILKSTAVDTGDPERRQGAGQVDAGEAVQTVVPPANFAVDITTVPTSITAGRQLTVDYTVKNTGDKSDSQRVALRVDDTEIKNTTVTLDPSDSVSGTFTYQTTTGDVGTRTLTVTSDDDSADQAVDLVEPALRLANTSLKPDSVTTGSTNSYTLTADVYNVSDDDQRETVTISLPTALTLTSTAETTEATATDADGETVDISVNESDNNAIALTMSPDTDAELRDLTLTVNFTAQANSPPTVSITNTSLEPDSVATGSTDEFVLTADVYNVSDDGQPETITISLPTALTLTSTVKATEATATDTDGESVDVAVEETDNNTVTLSMSPDTDAELRDLTLRINFAAKTTNTG
jgi:subtilisin family serine protease